MSDHSTLEERLTRSLDQQATGLHDAPFTLDDVRGRARGIQRRRRVVAGGVAAAVVAVALPAALLAGGGGPKTDGIDPAPPVVPTSPASSVLHDGVLTRPDGGTVAVDLEEVTSIGVLADGRIIATTNGDQEIQVLAADGSPEASYPVMTTTFTMGVDDRTVAWTDPEFRIQVLESGEPEPVAFPGIPMPGESEGSIDAVLGSGCAEGGCTVLGGDYSTTTHEITLDGATELATPEPFRVSSVSPDQKLWAVQYADYDDLQYGCAGLYDVDAAAIVARSCEAANLHFSPDGRHLLSQFAENHMAGEVTVLDLQLQEVSTFDPKPEVVGSVGWADAEHLAVGLAGLQDSAWTLVRVPVDGGPAEVVDGPTPGMNPENGDDYLFSS